MKKFDEVLRIRREKVENILNTITLILVLCLTILLIITYSKLNSKDIKSCINAGNTKQYCEKGF